MLLDEIRHQHETPSYATGRQHFDEWLDAEPAAVDTARDDFLQALGMVP